MLNQSTPKLPSFLFNRNLKKVKEYGMLSLFNSISETNAKIRYENTNLLKKMIEVENKPSNYHPVRLQVKDCPAFSKTGFVRNQTLRKIKVENSVITK